MSFYLKLFIVSCLKVVWMRLQRKFPFSSRLLASFFCPSIEFRGMSADCRQIKASRLVYLKSNNTCVPCRKTPPQPGWTVVLFTSPLFTFSSCLPACEKDVQKVCANSSEENLQPFKDKMEGFISAGESICPALGDEEMLIKACFQN